MATVPQVTRTAVGIVARLRGRLRTWGRVDAALVALLVLPWVVLLVDPLWVYSSLYRDNWAYFGFYQNLPAHLQAYPTLYSCGRLTALLPGWLAYRWLPPPTANLVLHLGLYYTAVLSAYVLLRRAAGRRAGFLASAALGGHFFFLRSVGSDYVDGFVVAYFLLTAALLSQAARSGWWRLWAAAAGATGGAMVVANLVAVVMLLPAAGLFLTLNRVGRRHPADAAGFWFGAGFLGLFVAVGLIARRVGGTFLFVLPSLNFIASFDKSQSAVYIHPVASWVAQASWLVFPAAAAVGAVVMLVREAVRGWRGGIVPPAVPVSLQVQHLALFGLLLAAHGHRGFGLLQAYHYASGTVMLTAFLAAAGQWRGGLDALSSTRFRGLAAVWCGAVVVSSLPAERLSAAGWADGVPLAVALTAAGAAFVFPQVFAARTWAVVAAAILFAAANGLVRDQFRMAHSLPAIAPKIALDRCQEMDPVRAEAFATIADAARWVRQLDDTGRVWFWYDLGEPLGPVYDMVGQTNCHHLRLLGLAFPALDDPTASGYPLGNLRTGATVVVFSPDPAAGEVAQARLRARGLDARLGECVEIGRPPVVLRATVVRIRKDGP